MAEARAYATRNREGSSWFSHEDLGATPSDQTSSPEKAPPVSPSANNGTDPSVGRTQMIKPTCNSNQWYKYDEAPDASSPSKEASKVSPRQPTGDWYAHDAPPSADDKKDQKPRVVTLEGESYCRRDKTGSSAAWFSHEHGSEPAPPGSQGQRVMSKEGCGNATRMRGESENWFDHDLSAAGNESGHMAKGRGIPPRSSEMHHVFHHSSDDAGK